MRNVKLLYLSLPNSNPWSLDDPVFEVSGSCDDVVTALIENVPGVNISADTNNVVAQFNLPQDIVKLHAALQELRSWVLIERIVAKLKEAGHGPTVIVGDEAGDGMYFDLKSHDLVTGSVLAKADGTLVFELESGDSTYFSLERHDGVMASMRYPTHVKRFTVDDEDDMVERAVSLVESFIAEVDHLEKMSELYARLYPLLADSLHVDPLLAAV